MLNHRVNHLCRTHFAIYAGVKSMINHINQRIVMQKHRFAIGVFALLL